MPEFPKLGPGICCVPASCPVRSGSAARRRIIISVNAHHKRVHGNTMPWRNSHTLAETPCNKLAGVTPTRMHHGGSVDTVALPVAANRATS